MPVEARWSADRFVVEVTGVLDWDESAQLFERFYGDPRAFYQRYVSLAEAWLDADEEE